MKKNRANQPLQRNASTGPFRISSRQLGVADQRTLGKRNHVRGDFIHSRR
jgi:hypothetical protein